MDRIGREPPDLPNFCAHTYIHWCIHCSYVYIVNCVNISGNQLWLLSLTGGSTLPNPKPICLFSGLKMKTSSLLLSLCACFGIPSIQDKMQNSIQVICVSVRTTHAIVIKQSMACVCTHINVCTYAVCLCAVVVKGKCRVCALLHNAGIL